jgi:hypothetical protein
MPCEPWLSVAISVTIRPALPKLAETSFSGFVAIFRPDCRQGYRWTQLCGEWGELLKCRLATGGKLLLADHMGDFEPIECC